MNMKSIARAIVALSTMAIPIVSSSPVQAVGPTGSYSSGIACVNMGAAAASIAVTFYSADNGTAVTTYSVPGSVAPKNNIVLFTPSIPGLPSSLQGSAVVSSDQQVSCTTDANRSDGTVGTVANPARSSTSESFDVTDASNILYAPQVLKNLGDATNGFYNSYVAVQNIESTAVTVTMAYYTRAGVAIVAATESVSIPPQASHYFYQDQNANLTSPCNCSVKISTSDPAKKIAATVAIYNDGTATAKSQMQAYNAQAVGGSQLIVPQWVRNFAGGYQSGAALMNIGATTTTVTATFTMNGTPYVNVSSVGPLKVIGYFAPNVAELLPVDSIAEGSRRGSAVFQGGPGSTLIANVNLRNDGFCVGAAVCAATPAKEVGLGQSLNSLLSTKATTKALVTRYPKALGGELITGGFTVANATGSPGTCSLEYVGAFTDSGIALAANGSFGRFAASVAGVTSGTQNPVSIVCTVAVLVTANSRSELATYRGDSGTSWNVVNLP